VITGGSTIVNQDFFPARRVWERYGVTSMTLWRWIRDPEMNFPRPVYLGRFRYWRIAELEAWEAEQAQRDAAA
jgi:predicted DNA-binding transcriptional regulator AlpA